MREAGEADQQADQADQAESCCCGFYCWQTRRCILRRRVKPQMELKWSVPASSHMYSSLTCLVPAAGFYADAGSPPPLLEAYWILALPEHFQEAVLKECPAMVVLAYFVGAESKMYTEPPMAAELSNIGFSLLQRMERRTQDLIRESWPIDAALNRIKTVQESIQRLKETPLPSAGLLDLVLAYCKEDLQWLQVALPHWLQGPTRLFIYEKCGQAAELGSLPAHIKVLREQVVDGPPGGRKDECSAYLTHLSKIVTKDVALYTLFLQADALNHVWPYYLHLVMRTMQLRSLDVAFLHLGQSRMVASTSECKRAIFKQVVGREQRQMATGYCCAQFLVRQDLILGNREVWPRALKAMDEPLPVGCEHVRRGSGMHCLVFESIWHAMFGFPESFTPRAEDVTLPSCLRIPETDESDLPDGLRSTFYLERATGDDDISWLEKLMAKESEDMSGARSLGYVGWDQATK